MNRNEDQLPIDRHFAGFMCRLADTNEAHLLGVFAELSQALRQQHSCLELDNRPNADELIAELEGLACVGVAGAVTPLILDGRRLYLQRYHQAECRIATALMARNQPVVGLTGTMLKPLIAPLVKETAAQDGQALAALQALSRRLTIITGGPGTGKTTIVRTLISAMRQLPDGQNTIIKLAAPTGKAAMRLNQSLHAATDDNSQQTEMTVTTLHRLLGLRADGRSWQFDADNPLKLDMLVVDEVSMVDLAMMDRLLQALPAEARLVLLGDPHQLPSVETGNLLMDLCKYPAGYSAEFSQLAEEVLGTKPTPNTGTTDMARQSHQHGLQDAVVTLTHSYRFDADKGIGQLARAIQQGNAITANEAVELAPWQSIADAPGSLAERYLDYLALTKDDQCSPDQLLLGFEKLRILIAQRESTLGVINLNCAIEDWLTQNGWRNGDSAFYRGRPIMILRNDYARGLFNGDVGICVVDTDSGTGHHTMQVAFRNSAGDVTLHLAASLPAHETCFAMTVHKSQGSEFDEVILVLPPTETRGMSHLATRELLYTAATRARSRITLYSSDAVLEEAMRRHASRESGLGERFL